MSKYLQYRRYQLILEKLNKKPYSSFLEIDEALQQHDILITKRTLQRDLDTIRNEFLIEIPYDRSRDGYFIDYQESLLEDVESFAHFLEIVNTADLLVNTLSEGKNALQYISFDSTGNFNGVKNLKPLLKAIQDKRTISFDHENYQTGQISPYVLQPYALREYLNRWYLVGIAKGEEAFRKFGVDRIQNIQISTEVFERNPEKNPHALFGQIIGLELTDKKLEPVVLSFKPQQGKYIKSLKLHQSQKILLDNEQELRIELLLIPNFELIQNILMHGSLVKVLQPGWLADKVVRILQSAVRQYQG